MIHDLPKADLMEACRHWKTVYDEHGRPLERYKVFDKSEYQKLQREIGRAGRQLLADFVRWQVLTLGMGETAANSIAAIVWVSLYTTGADPIQILRNPGGMRWPRQTRLRSGLTRLVAWMLEDPDTEPEDRAWARTLAKDMMLLPPPPEMLGFPGGPGRTRKDPNKPLRYKAPVAHTPPIMEQDILVLKEVIERRHNREGFRRPWARPVVGIWFSCGASVDELLYVEQSSAREALAEYEETRTGGLALWSTGRKARIVPSAFIEDELRTLAHWPAEWGTLADIVGRGKFAAASVALRREIRETFIESGIIERGTPIPHKNFRRSLAEHCYRRSGDWVTVQQLFSLSYATIKKMVHLPTDKDLLEQATRD